MKVSRKSRILAIGLMLALLSLLAAVGASAAKSKPGLDLSYGRQGIVSAQPPSGSGSSEQTWFATAPDGSAYVLGSGRTCGATTCTPSSNLYRWTPDGSFDASFGGDGSLEVPSTPYVELAPPGEGMSLALDSRGRPLVTAIKSGSVVVRRYSSAGILDTSFGSGGSIAIPCGSCEHDQVWLLPAANERTVVEVQTALPPAPGGFGSSLGGQVSFTRLTPGGRPERHFGSEGTVTIKLGRRAYPGKAAVTAKGGLLLGAAGCCSGTGSYLIRVSAKGAIDTKFGRAAGRSLGRLSRDGETSNLVALLPRANGTVDVVGADPIKGGFDLRLKADGDRARFGDDGLKALSFAPEAAALGAEGGIFAIGARATGPYSAFRLLANGRVDSAYGSSGIAVPGSGTGYSLGPPSRGKVLVFDRGDHECREGCPSTPGLVRFDEGSGKG